MLYRITINSSFFIFHSSFGMKKSLTDMLCQGRIYFAVPPCFTVSRALCGIRSYSRQLTYASRRRILSLPAFDCALRGPFGGLFPARLSPSRTLCKGIAALISASTVSYEITRILAVSTLCVKQVTGDIHEKNNSISPHNYEL